MRKAIKNSLWYRSKELSPLIKSSSVIFDLQYKDPWILRLHRYLLLIINCLCWLSGTIDSSDSVSEQILPALSSRSTLFQVDMVEPAPPFCSAEFWIRAGGSSSSSERDCDLWEGERHRRITDTSDQHLLQCGGATSRGQYNKPNRTTVRSQQTAHSIDPCGRFLQGNKGFALAGNRTRVHQRLCSILLLLWLLPMENDLTIIS